MLKTLHHPGKVFLTGILILTFFQACKQDELPVNPLVESYDSEVVPKME
ncbi:MAG: hypothetical protein IPO07_28155 [Haliscomenobacter sp.]|nr:hypothetical protein [Haliscomenobacter sp.]MBK9492228.1 hypothetical protein [Haliscomenobacter sp.]